LGLKNVSATYQWLVNQMFSEQIRKNMKVMVTTCSWRQTRQQPFFGGLWCLEEVKHEVEPNKVHLWSYNRKILGLYNDLKGYRGLGSARARTHLHGTRVW